MAIASPALAQEPTVPQPPVIVTTGEATVTRAPDVAFVGVAVETRAKSPRDAQRQNAAAMAAVHQRIAGAGIAKDAVRTIGYDVQQEFDFVNGRRVARDFLARDTIEVRVDDIARVGELLDVVVEAGATSISGVRFDLKDRSAAERDALRLAVLDARERAEAAAAGAGRAIDRVLRVEDLRQTVSPPRPLVMRMAAAAEAQPATPIEAGTIELHAQVTLTSSIK
jgi:uncharacterized protein YggE